MKQYIRHAICMFIAVSLCVAPVYAQSVARQKAAQHNRSNAHSQISTLNSQLSNLSVARPTLALQTGHSGWVECIAFSPDGRLAATGSMDKTARIWNVRTGEMLAVIPGHKSLVNNVLFSPDGRLLITYSPVDPALRIYDMQRGRIVTIPVTGSTGWVQAAFSPDGEKLAAIGNQEVHLWNLHTLKQEGVSRFSTPEEVYSLAFSPDSTQIAIGGLDPFGWDAQRGVALLLDARTLKPLRTLRTKGQVLRAAFASDSRSLVTESDLVNEDPSWTSEVRLWDARTGDLRATLYDALSSAVCSIASQGSLIALGNVPKPGDVRLIDLRTGQARGEWKASDGKLDRIVLSPDGSRLATFALKHPFIIWNTSTLQPVSAIPELDSWMAPETVFSANNRLLATSGMYSDARLWSVDTGKLAIDLRGQEGEIAGFALAPDRQTVAIGCDDQAVRLWNLQTGRLRATLPCHEVVRSVAYAPDGSLLAAAASNSGEDGRLCLWNAKTLQSRGETSLEHGADGLAFSPNSRLLVMGGILQQIHGTRIVIPSNPAAGQGGGSSTSVYPEMTGVGGSFRSAYLWDLAEGMHREMLPDQPGQITVFAFSQDSQTLAAGSYSDYNDPDHNRAAVRLWDTVTNHPEGTITPLGTDVFALAFSPDSRTLAIGFGEGNKTQQGRLWDVATGKIKAKLEATDDSVVALAYSPDGRILAGSVAGKVQLWNAANGHLLGVLGGSYSEFVTALTFSADGRTLVTTCEEFRTRLWDVAAEREIPLQSLKQLTPFPTRFLYPLSTEGAALVLHDPRDGRVLARLIAIPPPSNPDQTAPQPPVTSGDNWFVVTPEGYFDGSSDAARYIKWNLNGHLYPAERYLRRFRRPDLVLKALHGEKITAPRLTTDDVPPSAQILGLKEGDQAASDPLKVRIETRGLHPVKQVEIFVNGRPLAPGEARPIEADARPIEADARQPDTPARFLQHFTFRVSLPQGAAEIHLRAVAYDAADLGSDPVEIVLHRSGMQEAAGNLYVLSIGVSHYQHGGGPGTGARGQFSNLRYPAADAQAISARFQKEGKPLYERVEVKSLTEGQATLANVRAGLRWLQESVGPGQIDTAVIYLSGHGYSTPDGRYYFAPYDFDLTHVEQAGLSGQELREALGGRLRAKRVFLFVDTCHSGGLGGRSDDLATAIGEGVFVLASSTASEYAYESAAWGHGAFTLALLHTLDNKALEDQGAIRFADLVSGLRREMGVLLRQEGRSSAEQEPCVPLAGRRLGEPVVEARMKDE